jgi:hypothetical protein
MYLILQESEESMLFLFITTGSITNIVLSVLHVLFYLSSNNLK